MMFVLATQVKGSSTPKAKSNMGCLFLFGGGEGFRWKYLNQCARALVDGSSLTHYLRRVLCIHGSFAGFLNHEQDSFSV